jgi:hypothetical protein
MCKKKKFSYMVPRRFIFVCPCVWVSLRKGSITFHSLHGSPRNFQGSLNSSQVIFGQVIWTPRPSGSGPNPEKGGFCQIYLLPGFWGSGVVSYLFGTGRTRRKKCWERNFEFWPTAWENEAGRRGWPWGWPKFWNFNIFYKSDPY